MKIAVIGAGHWGMNLVRNLNDLDVLTHVVEKKTESIDNISSDFPWFNALITMNYYWNQTLMLLL